MGSLAFPLGLVIGSLYASIYMGIAWYRDVSKRWH